MPRFLVQIDVRLPPQMPEDERMALLARERARGFELKDAGLIEHMWRVPGRLANAGVWRTRSATELHDALASLPVWRWTKVSVTPLADHHLTNDPEEEGPR